MPSLDGWQSQLSLSKDWGTHRSRHSKSMDNASLNHSDIFILMIGTYPQSFQVPGPVWLTAQRILGFFDRPCQHSARQIIRCTTDLISNSALLSNNFVWLDSRQTWTSAHGSSLTALFSIQLECSDGDLFISGTRIIFRFPLQVM